MNLNELKDIIKHLKKVVPCNTCQQKFDDNEIKVLSTYDNEALFHFECSNCMNQLIIHVSVSEKEKSENKMNIQTQNAQHISQNDVLDIHNFLIRFNGDFKKLFTKTR